MSRRRSQVMSVKSMIATIIALLAVAGGAAVAAPPVHAATPQCGDSCTDLFSAISATVGKPTYVIASYEQGDYVDAPIVLADASNTNPGEDFITHDAGLVSDFYADNLVSTLVYDNYGGGTQSAPDDAAFEIEYAPGGSATGLCLGTATTAVNGSDVGLHACDVSGTTVWIVDSSASITSSFVPLISGTNTDIADPLVLTYPPGASPSYVPDPVLLTENLDTSASQAPDNQLWSEGTGVLNALSMTTPADITVDATRPSGAKVAYPAPVVTDTGASSPPPAVCTPASSSVFPIGTTTVHCTATDPDDTPSTVSTSFTITVQGAAVQLADLLQAADGVGIRNSLAGTVASAQRQLSARHLFLACETLSLFVAEVMGQTPRHIPPATAAQLITDARRIQAVLGCGLWPPFL
jgi:hypothetical protein